MAIYGASALRYYAEMLPTLSLSSFLTLTIFLDLLIERAMKAAILFLSLSYIFLSVLPLN